MPSEASRPLCPWCVIGEHFCRGCSATLTHDDCGTQRYGVCDDCAPLMQARP